MPDLKPVALITGASAGIGAALADVFADARPRSWCWWRAARRSSRRWPTRSRRRGRRAAACHRGRSGEPDAPARIAEELRERGLEPEFVVNNAGFGLLGPAASLDREQQLAMIDLNVRALTDLSLRFVDSLARHKGGILNVASVASFMPGPGMAVYHATKAYVLSFSEALHHELKPHGVRVTALCPGPVDTEFMARAGVPSTISRASSRVGRTRRARRLQRPDARPPRRGAGLRQQGRWTAAAHCCRARALCSV